MAFVVVVVADVVRAIRLFDGSQVDRFEVFVPETFEDVVDSFLSADADKSLLYIELARFDAVVIFLVYCDRHIKINIELV